MRQFLLRLVIVGCFLGAADPLLGRDVELFDRFNLKLEASWVRLNTEMRIDSKSLGEGTTLSFEDDLGLDDDAAVPSAAFEWQFRQKHRLALRWQDVDRGSTTQVLEEIRIGDEIIPVDAVLGVAFDIETWAVDYTYYPWVEARWAAGIGFGFRVMDLRAVFIANGLEVEADGSVTAPLPYVNFEYRRVLGEKWRMRTGLGWLAVEIQDIKGWQVIGRFSIEHQTFANAGFGFGLNYSTVGAEANGREFRGAVDMDIHDGSLYVRFHF